MEHNQTENDVTSREILKKEVKTAALNLKNELIPAMESLMDQLRDNVNKNTPVSIKPHDLFS